MYNRDILRILSNSLMMGNQLEPKLILNILDTIDDLLNLDNYFGLKDTPRCVLGDFERAGGLDGLEEI